MYSPSIPEIQNHRFMEANQTISLIYLGSDYFIVKFTKEDNMTKVLKNGPWFINDHYLSVQWWEPNFVASKVIQVHLTVWVRPP